MAGLNVKKRGGSRFMDVDTLLMEQNKTQCQQKEIIGIQIIKASDEVGLEDQEFGMKIVAEGGEFLPTHFGRRQKCVVRDAWDSGLGSSFLVPIFPRFLPKIFCCREQEARAFFSFFAVAGAAFSTAFAFSRFLDKFD